MNSMSHIAPMLLIAITVRCEILSTGMSSGAVDHLGSIFSKIGMID